MEENAANEDGTLGNTNTIISLSTSLDDATMNPWMILLAETVIQKLLQNQHMQSTVMKKLRSLQQGCFSETATELLKASSSAAIPIYNTPCVVNEGTINILWQIDALYVHGVKSYSQVIKVWGILEDTGSDGLNKLLEGIDATHAMYTVERATLCCQPEIFKVKCIRPRICPDIDVYANISKPHSHSFSETDSGFSFVDVVVTIKFIPLSQTVLRCLRLGVPAEHPFQLSKEEYEIIDEHRSIVLLGRSGTGKTTCLIFRLWLSYKRNYARRLLGLPSPVFPRAPAQHHNGVHQLFLTMSPILCNRVQKYFERLKASLELCYADPQTIMDLIKSARESRLTSHAHASKDELEDVKEEDDMFREIPNDLRKLKDEDFPLFITFRKLLQMLAGTVLHEEDLDDDDLDNTDGSDDIPTWLRGREVTYDLFERYYWPKIDERKSRKQSPALIWAEITALIKGSELTLMNEQAWISAEEYVTSSHRCFPNFQHQRDLLYHIFEQYEQIKKQHGHHDLMDFVHHIYRRLLKIGYSGVSIHELYVDEVQDLTVSQLKLLQLICENPKGFFLAGDTAQTISRGSAFRFEDVKAMMFHSYEEKLDRRIHQVVDLQDFMPVTVQLTKNYRSHSGILQLAASIVDLIDMYFKGSIDKLERDNGVLEGPLPVLLEAHPIAAMGFQSIKVSSDIPVDFGADQVILVRDHDAKHRIRGIVQTGLIMTIYEAKGMEFNDVMIFDFFNNSSAELNWRVLLASVEGIQTAFPKFDPLKHTILCTELKQLYTAITRARKQLWIIETNKDYSFPILSYWKSLGLIQVLTVSGIGGSSLNDKLKTIAKKSSPQEWLERGMVYFENQLYEQASYCFMNAGEQKKQDLCEAYIKKKAAQESMDAGNTSGGQKLYFQAAELFHNLGRVQAAVTCLLSGGYFIQAGEILEKSGDLCSAADAFVRAKEYQRAAKCMEKAERYTEAVRLYKDGGLIEIAVERLKMLDYRQNVEDRVVNRIIEMFCLPILAKRQFLNNVELNRQVQEALELMEPKNRERFLVEHGYVEKLIELNNQKKEYGKLGELYAKNNQSKDAAECFLKAAEELKTLGNKQISESALYSLKTWTDRSAHWMLQYLRDQIKMKYIDLLPFEIVHGSVCGEIETKETRKDFETAFSFLKRARETLCSVKSLCSPVDPVLIYSLSNTSFVDYCLVQARVLAAQVEGSESELQNCLNSFQKSLYRGWVVGEFSILVILCHFYMSSQNTSELRLNYCKRLMELYGRICDSVRKIESQGMETEVIKSLEMFFMVESHAQEGFYLMREDPVNKPVISELTKWQDESLKQNVETTSIITDATPLNCTCKMWLCSKHDTMEAMMLMLGKLVYRIIAFGVDQGKKVSDLQEPCHAFAILGSCPRQGCRFSHAKISLQYISNFLLNLTQQSRLAAQQVHLAKKMSEHLERDEVNRAMKLLRFWLEKLQENLQIVSPLVSSSLAISHAFQNQDMPTDALKGLIARVWIRSEYLHSDAGYPMQILYIVMQLGCNNIPSYMYKLSTPVLYSGNKLPPGLVFDPSPLDPRRKIMPIHFLLVSMLKCAINGLPGTFVRLGIRYIRYAQRCQEMTFGKGWNILWLLELTAGVALAIIRQFDHVAIPSSVLYSFLQNYPVFCKGILYEHPFNWHAALHDICELAFYFWENRSSFWYYIDQKIAAVLRIQTVIVLSCSHLPRKEQNMMYQRMFPQLLWLSQRLQVPNFSNLLQISSFTQFYGPFLEVLQQTLDPIVAVKLAGKQSASWFSDPVKSKFEVDRNGALIKINESPVNDQIQLENVAYFEAQEDAHLNSVNSEVEVEDVGIHRDLENILFEQEKAAKVLQIWFRKCQKERRTRTHEESKWEKFYKEAYKATRSWLLSAEPLQDGVVELLYRKRYRMYFLGKVAVLIHQLKCANQCLDNMLRKATRETSGNSSNPKSQAELEIHLDRLQSLRDIKDDIDTCLEEMSTGNERHKLADWEYLLKVEDEAALVLDKFRKCYGSNKKNKRRPRDSLHEFPL